MIVWRGWGILSVAIAVLAMAAVQLATGQLEIGMRSDPWALRWHTAIALVIAASVNFWAGRRLNRRRGRVAIDATTGRRFALRGRHDLFFIPMEYWSIAFVLGAAGLLLVR
jgi:hypothetical protein